MAASFVHETPVGRVVFGRGTLERVPDEAAAMGRRVLVVAGGSAAAAGDRLLAALGERSAGAFGTVAQHVPEALAAQAVAAARQAAADVLCSLGGGSATGLAKAVAVELDLPIVAVPTTYAGSEATPVFGITGERKRVGVDPRALPRVVVYDPELTTGLPARVTAASGLNAIAHAVAVRAGGHGDRLAALQAENALRLLATALPAAVAEPADLGARGDLLLGAYLAAGALAAAGTGLHHRLCHLLGGRHRLVHADVHAVLLPHTIARDEALGADGRGAVAALLGADDPAEGLWRLARQVGAPASLAALGLDVGVLDDTAAEAARAARHPRAGDVAWFRTLLGDAHDGIPPVQPPSAHNPDKRRRRR